MGTEWSTIFDALPMSDAQLANLASVREDFRTLGLALYNKLPEGRYKAMVKTKLEEAAMLATKAISHS
jgi:hypothetical protein